METPIWKWIVAIVWDLLDFTIFRIPVIGTITDIIGVFIAVGLWGWSGVIASWEVLDPTDQLDAEIPSCTLIGLLPYLLPYLKNKE